jgi:CheY-like chemotaxis protein
MTDGTRHGARILVVEDVEETRDGIERLLRADGYRVDTARDEADAVRRARHDAPDLILVSVGGTVDAIVALVARVYRAAGLREGIPVVIFCVPSLDQGAEQALSPDVYVCRPDNFDQLRALLRRLSGGAPRRAP